MIILEKIDYNDKELLNKILLWRNDNITRQYSNNSNVITEDIFKIIINKYKESTIDPLIIKYNNINVGIITFVLSNDIYYIGINIDPDYRNKHIGNLSLQYLLENYKKYFNMNITIHALIKKENKSSLKLFSKYFDYLNEDDNNIVYYKNFII